MIIIIEWFCRLFTFVNFYGDQSFSFMVMVKMMLSHFNRIASTYIWLIGSISVKSFH